MLFNICEGKRMNFVSLLDCIYEQNDKCSKRILQKEIEKRKSLIIIWVECVSKVAQKKGIALV